LVRRLRGGGDLERLEDGARRARRGLGDRERLEDGERRRSRDLSLGRSRPPRSRPLEGMYRSRSRRGRGERLRRLRSVSNWHMQ
jgi:hypothetical protein